MIVGGLAIFGGLFAWAGATNDEEGASDKSVTSSIDREADLATAQSLIDTWDAAGLPLGEVRNNTANGCAGDLAEFCTALLTTDYVSVRVFVNPSDAEAWTGPGREAHTMGRVNASFGGDSDFSPFDTAPYIEIMQETLGASSP